jgi:hypothetical protein
MTATVVKLPHDGGGTPGEPPSEDARLAGLIAAAEDMDSRLVPARLFAVEALARMDDAGATSGLLGLCDDRRMAPALRKGACEALQSRTLGAEHLLQALERHEAFLQGTTAPPVGALARAAAKLGEKRAVGPLISHLKDPHTPSEDLPALVTALRDLGDAAAAEPLGAFLLMYHADPVDEDLVRALELIPEALVQLVGPASSETLETVTYDGLGAFGVRERARIALNALQQTARVAEQKEHAEQEAQNKEASKETKPEPQEPTHLTTAVVTEALRPVEDQLKGCLKAAGPSVFNARLILVVEQGKLLMASVVPKNLQGCIEPLVRSQTFPATKSGRREQISHTIKRF